MSSNINTQGRCLCGAVEMKSDSVSADVGACHCGTCRSWTGGPLLVVDCGENLVLSGEDNIVRYDSSEWAQRGFCKKCGTHLFYYLKARNQYMVPAGFFDKEVDFKLDHQVFIDEKPQYYSFANETKNMLGDEVFAYFGKL